MCTRLSLLPERDCSGPRRNHRCRQPTARLVSNPIRGKSQDLRPAVVVGIPRVACLSAPPVRPRRRLLPAWNEYLDGLTIDRLVFYASAVPCRIFSESLSPTISRRGRCAHQKCAMSHKNWFMPDQARNRKTRARLVARSRGSSPRLRSTSAPPVQGTCRQPCHREASPSECPAARSDPGRNRRPWQAGSDPTRRVVSPA